MSGVSIDKVRPIRVNSNTFSITNKSKNPDLQDINGHPSSVKNRSSQSCRPNSSFVYSKQRTSSASHGTNSCLSYIGKRSSTFGKTVANSNLNDSQRIPPRPQKQKQSSKN